MDDRFFADEWYRVAALTPRLAAHVRIVSQRTRGERWTLLVDEATGRTHRVNDAAWDIVGRCDGRHTLQAIWDAACAARGADAPTQGETIRVVARLAEHGVMQSGAPLALAVERDASTHDRSPRVRAALNPFAIRMPLFDPSAFLARTQRVVSPVFTRAGGVAWALLVLLAAAALALSDDSIIAYAHRHAHDPHLWWIAALSYGPMKLLHELGHAYAIRHGGGEVQRIGITWLLAMPVPWIDGRAVGAMRDRRMRVLACGIGIAVELALAAIATFVWLATRDGPVREAAFAVMSIGAVSSVLFNGNPLVRFDGYYVLSDALDIPNLAPRAQALVRALWLRDVLRMRSVVLPDRARGESGWLVAYGIAAATYRGVIACGVVFWLAHGSAAAAIALAAYLAGAWAIWPALRGTVALAHVRAPRAERRRARAIACGLALFAAAGLVAVPVAHVRVVEAVVWMPDDAVVRTDVDGFVRATPASDGALVARGQPLFALDNPQLEVDRAVAAARVTALRTEAYRASARDAAQAVSLQATLDAAQAELDRATRAVASLEPVAQTTGRLVVPHASDLAGTFVSRGTLLGFVFADEGTLLRAALDDADAAALRRGVAHIDAWVDGRAYPARVIRETPSGTKALPSAAFGEVGGGSIETDPSDASGRTARAPVYLVDVALDRRVVAHVGGRAQVRMAFAPEPLVVQWARAFAQSFMRQVAPQAW